MAPRTEFAREPCVAVEQAANGIADGFVGVVALDQDGIERRDAALRSPAGSFEKFRQIGEDRRGETSGCRRLSGGESDFALGQGEPRERIH